MNHQHRVEEFYETKRGSIPTPREAWGYLVEEIRELDEASGGADRKHELKEMADVAYTLYGYAIAQGYDLDAAFLAVHESNLTKQRSPVGKVQKGPGYVAPDLRGAVR